MAKPAAGNPDDPAQLVLATVTKQFGPGSLMQMGDQELVPVEVISTSSVGLDHALGIGGLPRGRVTEIYGPEGSGKALALDTPIPTPKGWTTMGALSVGDQVFASDGSPTTVTFATQVMTGRPCYEVQFSDGSKIVADSEHLWLTETLWDREQRNGWGLIPRTTLEIAETVWARDGFCLNHAIPVCRPLEYPEQELLISPYTLGAWLGDGSSACSEITSADEEILAHIRNDGYVVTPPGPRIHERTPSYRIFLPPRQERECLICLDGKVAARGLCRNCWARQKSAGTLSDWPLIGQPVSLQSQLRTLGVLTDKHVPERYLRASVAQRLALLQGLMDTDGTVGSDGQCEFSVTCRRLAEGVYDLLIGLGVKTVWREAPAVLNGRQTGIRYRFGFMTRLPVFRLGRKSARLSPGTRWAKMRYIQAVESVPSVPVRCIQVDDPEHTYLAGRECVPTHNTTLALHAIANVQRAGGLAVMIDAEHALDMEYAAAIGVDTERLLLNQPDTGEQGLEIADMCIRSGVVDIVVIDSVSALVPRAEIEGMMGDSHIGLQARLMSQALRKITPAVGATKTACVFINQLREKVGVVFGNPEVTSGGKALKFYASVRLDIRKIEILKDGPVSVGQKVRIKVVKNKLAPPFRQYETDIIWGRGFSREGELIELGVQYGLVQKGGAWYSCNGIRLGQGKENARQFLEGNREMAYALEQDLRKLMSQGAARAVPLPVLSASSPADLIAGSGLPLVGNGSLADLAGLDLGAGESRGGNDPETQ